jgi:(p)ppGpp synthase/HD superfamily hydrolase
MVDLKPAIEIAVEVHGEQVDKCGDPYLFHVFRVAMDMETNEERVVAFLHDSLEDIPKGLTRLRVDRMIEFWYDRALLDKVWALTRGEEETYMEYIERLSSTPIAVKVKLADLMDNMRTDRLEKLPAEDRVRLLKKYQEAYEFLSHLERKQAQ